ncbi:MAG: ribosome biogenesis GTP-binding protein YihA/YsxC [Thermodesulfobacteriota bacterium]
MSRPGPENDYRVGQARYVASAVRPGQYPPADRPEVAFAGRSNVGKSSLLNRLLGRRQLARTGATPGRTQTVNFFDVDGRLYFVDLPGYGYAKVPLEVRAAWRPMVEKYLTSNRDLRLVVLLVDLRRDPGTEEADLIGWLNGLGRPALVTATKADKVTRSRRKSRLEAIRKALGLAEPPVVFSAATGEGRSEVWRRLAGACGLDSLN